MKWVVDGLPYPVVVGAEAAAEVARVVPAGASAVVIFDRRIEPRAAAVTNALRASGVAVRAALGIAAGERNKNQRTVNALYRALLAAGAERETVIVAVGGGTLTDVAGFVAATYLRGLAWIAVPTTLLGMVDAALGGKTGIDLPEGKNLVGAIWEPQLVAADLPALDTLPVAQRKAGLAEIIKAAIVGDPPLLDAVRRAKLRAAAETWGPIAAAAAAVKARIVAADLRERGVRAQLNLGHTSAHAIEHASRYRIAHGPAVAIGLRVAGILGRDRTGWPLEDHARVLRALGKAGLPITLPAEIDVPAVAAAMRFDKKRSQGALQFVLPVRLGEVRSGSMVEEPAVVAALDACRSAPHEDGW